jgi:transposase
MNNYKVFIGVDVSKDYFTTTVLFDARKEIFKVVSKAEEFEKRIKPYIRVLDKSEALILMEHTGVYHLPLAEYLVEREYHVAVINPYSMKKFVEAKMSRAKTDRVDSAYIAEYGKQFFDGNLFKPKTEIQKQIETKLRILEDFQNQLNMLKNQRHALIWIPMKKPEGNLAYYDEVIEVLKKKIMELEKEIERLCKENYPREYELLRSIPGIKNRAISMILSILRGFEGFDNAKNVGSYLGICPSPVESGTSVQGRGGIRKRGSSYARKVLYLCGLSAIRANRYCRELYERLVKKGKAKKLAIVAAGHKLIRQAFGVLKSGQLFQANLCFNCLT